MKKIFIISILVLSNVFISASAFRHPPGNYKKTCYGCTMVGNRLDCFCKDRQGFTNHTHLKKVHRCNFIENINGNLRCTNRRRPHQDRPPRWRQRVRNFNAGPIWNNWDAKRKCPRVCRNHHAKWTGQWYTTVFGQMSVCQCRQSWW